MNIIYNRELTKENLELFKLMEEFMYINLKDKKFYYKITIHFNELEDKLNGLSYIGKFSMRPGSPYQPYIKISDYAIRLSSNASILKGEETFNSFEKYRLLVIFHELAHLITTYNDPDKFYLMTKDNALNFDKTDENEVNELDIGFLKSKHLI